MTDETGIAKTPAKISLREQADEAHKELKNRHRYYPSQVRAGKMTPAEAEVGFAVMRAIRDTMSLFAEYEIEVRAALRNAIEARRTLESDPLAQTITEAFPDARPVEVRDVDDNEQFEFMGPDASSDGGLAAVLPTDHPAVAGPAP